MEVTHEILVLEDGNPSEMADGSPSFGGKSQDLNCCSAQGTDVSLVNETGTSTMSRCFDLFNFHPNSGQTIKTARTPNRSLPWATRALAQTSEGPSSSPPEAQNSLLSPPRFVYLYLKKLGCQRYRWQKHFCLQRRHEDSVSTSGILQVQAPKPP